MQRSMILAAFVLFSAAFAFAQTPTPAPVTEPAPAAKPKAKAKEKLFVPMAVLKTVVQKYATAESVHFSTEEEDGKVVYEASLKIAHGEKAQRIDVTLSADGKVLSSEELIEASALPESVRKGFADSKYAKATVSSIEKAVAEEKAETATYEFVVTLDGDGYELVFDASGKLAKEEKLAKK